MILCHGGVHESSLSDPSKNSHYNTIMLHRGGASQQEGGGPGGIEFREAPYFCVLRAERGRMLLQKRLSWQFTSFQISTEVA